MDDRLSKKRNQLDFYFSSFQDIFSIPYSNFKCNPYSNLRGSSEQKYYPEFLVEKKYSEKNLLNDYHETEFDVSLSSSESKGQLPSIKAKKAKKVIGLPYQKEIKKNEKLLKMKKVQTASNWFPGISQPNRAEEVRTSQPVVRPASSSGPAGKNSNKAHPEIVQSNSIMKTEPANSTRPQSKHKRVVLKSKIKRISEEHLQVSEEVFKDLASGTEDKEKEPRLECGEKHDGETEIQRPRSKRKGNNVNAERKVVGSDKVLDNDENGAKQVEDGAGEKKRKKEKRLEKEKPDKKEKRSEKEKVGKNEKKMHKEVKESREKFEKLEKKEDKVKSKERKTDKKEHQEEEKQVKVNKKLPPPTVSEIIGKHRSFNLNQLLNNKNTDFKGLMQEYLRRSGLPENTKIFIITGPYEYLRKTLISRGWVENTHTSSQAFDLRWTFNDCEADYKSLRPGQYFNHFPNNRELTTKSGLHKNLRQVMDHSTNIDTFYPRTYDLGDGTQVNEFIKDYQRTCSFNIIKKVLNGKNVNTEILGLALKIAKKFVNDFNDKCEALADDWDYSEDVVKRIVEYSENDGKDESLADEGSVKAAKEINDQLCKLVPQYQMDGYRNIWIVKPGLNARGSGVKCMQGLDNILECGVQLKARVVQKYIENPLLINNNKFDIRQWVLVTSFDPLTVYFYNTCYLRLCQMAFSLDSFEAYRHLANYSLQKHIAKVQEETVWSLSKFCEFLESSGSSWDSILPNIHYLVIKTLQSVKDSIDSRPECFELYGFDIILDTDLVPWLLEVNLSPACSERTDWLSSMLVSMGAGIIDVALTEQKKQPVYSHDMKAMRTIKSNQNKWVYLYKGEEFYYGDIENLPFAALEIIGEKVSLKREKIFDRRIVLSNAAGTIQRVFRGYLTRKEIKRAKENRISLIVQVVFRRKRAFESLETQVRLKSCIKIQSFVRKLLAIKKAEGLRKIKKIKYIQSHIKGFYQRNEFKKVKTRKSCLCIQKKFRQLLGKARVKKEIKIKNSILLIQKHWKKRYSIKTSSAKLIQSHFRNHLSHLNSKIKKIQSLFRGCQARKSLHSLKHKKLQTQVLKSYLQSLHSRLLIFSQKQSSSLLYIKSRLIQSKALSALNSIILSRHATLIQKQVRRHQAKSKYYPSIKAGLHQSLCIITIQKYLKGFKSRSSFNSQLQHYSATKIQKVFKGFKSRKFFQFLIILHESAKIIQRAYRNFRSRRKFQMMLRIRAQEVERKRRMERLKREQEVKALMASERLHTNSGTMRPPSLKVKQQMILEGKFAVKRKGSKKKCKNNDLSLEDLRSLPRAATQEGRKLKKTSPKECFGL